MKQGFLIFNQGWGKGPTSCRGNDYKWSLQLKCLLLQQLPFWFAWFSPFFTEYCCWKHLMLPLDSSIFSCSLHKIKISCPCFWSLVRPCYQAACLCFGFVTHILGTVHWYTVSLEGFSFHARWQQLMSPNPWSIYS